MIYMLHINNCSALSLFGGDGSNVINTERCISQGMQEVVPGKTMGNCLIV